MIANIIIGVGGTGAKVVESTLHCAVAGLIGPNLRVGLVDQDGSNGNVARTERLLVQVETARNRWRAEGGAHVLGESSLFDTNIQALSKPATWVPHPVKSTTLAQIFGRDSSMKPREKDLFDGLFAVGNSAANTEQNLALGKGYRGRPHIGAAAMASEVSDGADDIAFWQQLSQALDAARGATEVRVLLTGSVFGGAGAAGFPTLARLIRKRLGGIAKVRIGGVLMLPYFSFAPPPRAAGGTLGEDANVAVAQELLIQSQSALKHYYRQLRDEKIFDQLYLAGWQDPFDLGYHEAGDNDQVNPPLLPELVGAMAACRFFSTKIGNGPPQVLACAQANAGAFTWSDLPSPTDDLDAPYKALGRLLRFALAWKYWGGLVSRQRSGLALMGSGQPWYKRQKVNNIKYDATPVGAEVSALDAYVQELLTWAATMESFARRHNLLFGLWNTGNLASPGAQPWHSMVVPPTLDENSFQRIFGGLVLSDERTVSPPPAATLLQRLTQEEENDGGRRGLGIFVSALHAFCDVQPPVQA